MKLSPFFLHHSEHRFIQNKIKVRLSNPTKILALPIYNKCLHHLEY